MACALATVYMQDLAGDETCALRVQDRLHDIVNPAHMTDRVQLAQRLVGFSSMHRRSDDAWRDRVDPNAALGIFDRQGSGRRIDPALGQDANTEGTPSIA